MFPCYIVVFWQWNPNAITGIEVNTELFHDIHDANFYMDKKKSEGFHARIDYVEKFK